MTPSDITGITRQAEALAAQGDRQGAAQAYRQWLAHSQSPMDWAARFNLGVLLKDSGDLAGARQAFAAALAQNPGFDPARAALTLATPARGGENVHLYSLAWSPETLAQTDPDIAILDNSANPRPDWREYWPMRQFLLNTALDDNACYGFFSPKFSSKTGLTGAGVIDFIRSRPEADVFIFSPQADMGAFFLNVFEQGDTFDPGFLEACQALLAQVGHPVDWAALTMDSRQVVFSNFLVARPAFWRQWLALCEKIFHVAEANGTPAAAQANAPTTYPGAVPRKVFIIERIASLLLATQPWRCAPYSTFQCAWSGLPTAQFQNEAIASDALKLAYNETKDRAFLGAFAALRARIFPEAA
ncbi:MAG: tetratricopeptide repeat protein [Acidovorax sp.]